MRLPDYAGLPLNEAGWRKGHSWDEAARSTRERQCIPHVATYALRGPATIQFSRVLGQDDEQLVATDKVLGAIRQLSDKPIRFIINTHAHPDSTGGNEALAGRRIGGGTLVGASTGSTATVIAHEAVLAVLSAPVDKPCALPQVAWPTYAYPGDSKEVYTNGEAIQLFHPPAAHTDGDSIVFFRRSDVLATGDIYDNTGYPVIDGQHGGTFTGVIDALNRIIDIAIPKDWEEGGTVVIPGRGRIADVVEYRDMLTIIRDRIEDLIKKGMTLEQVQTARPTFEYDGRYGATSGPWTTAMSWKPPIET
jgi:glyoxylase-like metal-dependent hydrolase (beta-lactamase superfamily II)